MEFSSRASQRLANAISSLRTLRRYNRNMIKGITLVTPVASAAALERYASLLGALGFEPGRGWDDGTGRGQQYMDRTEREKGSRMRPSVTSVSPGTTRLVHKIVKRAWRANSHRMYLAPRAATAVQVLPPTLARASASRAPSASTTITQAVSASIANRASIKIRHIAWIACCVPLENRRTRACRRVSTVFLDGIHQRRATCASNALSTRARCAPSAT